MVAAALVHGGRVLAAQRSAPPELAGLWEFPGGKVEPGETEHEALIRECREEIGIEVIPRSLLGQVPDPYGRGDVRLWSAVLADLTARPTPLEHQELRWLSGVTLDGIEWLPGNLSFLAAVRPLLEP